MTALYNHLRRQITRDQYAYLPFSASGEQIDSAVAAYLKTLALPLQEREPLITLAVPGDKHFTCGYESKRRSRGQKDNKEMFHDNRQFRHNLETRISSAHPHIREFLDKSWPVYTAFEEQARQIVPAFERRAPGITKRFFPTDKDPLLFLRYVAYLTPENGEPLAMNHYDQAPITNPIRESKPGLAVGAVGHLKRVQHKPDHSICFVGPNLYNLIPETLQPDFPPGYHGVEDVPEEESRTPLPDGIVRWALVGFIWAYDLPFLPYEVCHPEAKTLKFTEGALPALPQKQPA